MTSQMFISEKKQDLLTKNSILKKVLFVLWTILLKNKEYNERKLIKQKKDIIIIYHFSL